MKLSLQIAGGILIAIFTLLLVYAGMRYAIEYQARVELENFRKQEQIKIDNARKAAEARLAAENARIAAAKAQESYQASKLQAFNQAYQPPKDCEGNVPESRYVECVNDKMRARQEFAEKSGLPGVTMKVGQ